MTHNRRIIALLLVLMSLSACLPPANNRPAKGYTFTPPTYRYTLRSVDRPEATAAKNGDGAIEPQAATPNGFSFTDNLIQLHARPDADKLNIELTNKSQQTIRLIWDSAVFVDLAGRSQRVIHSGVRLIDRAAPQSPSVVVRNGKLSDFMVPTDHIYLSKVRGAGWQTKPLVNGSGQIQFLIPVEHEGTTHEYILVYDVVQVTPAKFE